MSDRKIDYRDFETLDEVNQEFGNRNGTEIIICIETRIIGDVREYRVWFWVHL